MDEKRYIVGIDPGTRNLGIARFDRFTKEVRLMNVDVQIRPDPSMGGRLGITEHHDKNISEWVQRVVDELFEDVFRDAWIVGVELQPNLTRKKTFIVIGASFVMYLRGRGVRAIETNPRSLRAFFCTSDPEYAARKDLSEICARPFLGERAIRAARIKFYKGDKKYHVDAIEALLIALYLYYNEDKAWKQAYAVVFYKNPIGDMVPMRAMDAEVNLEGGIAVTKLRKMDKEMAKREIEESKQSRRKKSKYFGGGVIPAEPKKKRTKKNVE